MFTFDTEEDVARTARNQYDKLIKLQKSFLSII